MSGLAATQARPKRLFSQAKVIHDKIVHFFELDMSLALYFAQKLLRKAKLSRGSARTAKSCSKRQKLLNTLHSCRILAPPHPSLILFLRVSPGPRIPCHTESRATTCKWRAKGWLGWGYMYLAYLSWFLLAGSSLYPTKSARKSTTVAVWQMREKLAWKNLQKREHQGETWDYQLITVEDNVWLFIDR